MCEPITQELIEETIERFVDDDKSFTAFDVSLAVKDLARSRGEIVERHRDMKTTIHNTIELSLNNGLYERTLQDVGAKTDAWVYYPESGDPSQYTPLKRFDAPAAPAAAPAPQSATAVAPAPTAVVDDDDDGDMRGDGGPDARGTINVPTYLLRAAGINPTDSVYVVAGQDSDGDSTLTITKTAPSNLVPLTTYKVDPNGAVRISKGQLSAGGLLGKKYAYDSTADGVVVKIKS